MVFYRNIICEFYLTSTANQGSRWGPPQHNSQWGAQATQQWDGQAVWTQQQQDQWGQQSAWSQQQPVGWNQPTTNGAWNPQQQWQQPNTQWTAQQQPWGQQVTEHCFNSLLSARFFIIPIK